MSDLILPPTLAALLLAFTPCFQARSVVVFQWLVVGWIQCQGRRTLTGVALASGAVGEHTSPSSTASLAAHPGRWMPSGRCCSGWP